MSCRSLASKSSSSGEDVFGKDAMGPDHGKLCMSCWVNRYDYHVFEVMLKSRIFVERWIVAPVMGYRELVAYSSCSRGPNQAC